MSNKYKYNKEHGITPYSKNYEKDRKKFRKIMEKITNIRRDWAYDVSKKIVTNYKVIIVDKFEQPDNKKANLSTRIKRIINYNNRFHGMYNTNEILEYMANKYGCTYINAPKNTTCTCSFCGHKNPHLPLTQRFLTCEKCGEVIDRDMNASKNCYDFA